jgi:hypothetical protein
MGVDLNGPAIEVAIGLAFVFFLLSTVVSAITEGISWATKQRARKLEQGVLGLLGDNKVAKDLLKHALVQTDARKPSRWRRKQKPSYLSARNFSLALLDVVGKKGEKADDPLENVENGVKDLGPHTDVLETQLTLLLGDPAVTKLEDLRAAAEKWFDDAMDRVSGWYKRWSQWVACLLAVVVAVGLNANAIAIAERLTDEPTVRAAVVARAEAVASEEKGDAKAAGEKATDAVKGLESLGLPLLWPDGIFHGFDLAMVAGLLLTAIAISLGAPFWFDALGKLARLRTAGAKPKPEPEPEPEPVVVNVSSTAAAPPGSV